MLGIIPNLDDYSIIKMAAETLGISESQALTVLLEIGVHNILNYPCSESANLHEKIDKILSEGKYPELVQKLKAVWKQ